MGDLAKRCQEILDWKSSGLLVDGELRKLAAALEKVPDTYRLPVAENQTTTEAMKEIVRLAAKPDEDGVREAVEHIEMAQSRLRAAMMGDEPCKPCIDLAASYLQEATKALSTTGKPKP